jgi:transcriptional regulator with XRE-family HTH domain
LGTQVRTRRKALRVSATATAEAAGLSRVTLHRIEKGEPSVAMGAWVQVMAVLGLGLTALREPSAPPPSAAEGWIPVRIPLADFPQLRALAWQVHGADTLTPIEALDIYERNARHLDATAMPPHEQALLKALQTGLAHTAVFNAAEAPGV